MMCQNDTFYLTRRCIFAEMFQRKPVLPGTSDSDQLTKIFQLCGAPNEDNFPGWNRQDPKTEYAAHWAPMPRRVSSVLPEQCVSNSPCGCLTKSQTPFLHRASSETIDFLDRLLTLDPYRRMTAFESLDHDYFWTEPMPADPSSCVPLLSSCLTTPNQPFLLRFDSLPRYDDSHEFNRRRFLQNAPQHNGVPLPISQQPGGPTFFPQQPGGLGNGPGPGGPPIFFPPQNNGGGGYPPFPPPMNMNGNGWGQPPHPNQHQHNHPNNNNNFQRGGPGPGPGPSSLPPRPFLPNRPPAYNPSINPPPPQHMNPNGFPPPPQQILPPIRLAPGQPPPSFGPGPPGTNGRGLPPHPSLPPPPPPPSAAAWQPGPGSKRAREQRTGNGIGNGRGGRPSEGGGGSGNGLNYG